MTAQQYHLYIAALIESVRFTVAGRQYNVYSDIYFSIKAHECQVQFVMSYVM